MCCRRIFPVFWCSLPASPCFRKTLEIPVFLSTVNDLEAIGDNCEIILECLRRKKEGTVYFSETAMDELKSLAQKASYLMNLAVDVSRQL